MRIKYTPQRSDVMYKIDGEVVYIKSGDKVTKVDFSNLKNGRLESAINHISNAEKVDGELIVTLIQPLDKDGNELPAIVDFKVDEYEEAEVVWKTQEEIEREKSRISKTDILELAILELAVELEKLKGDK